MLSSPNNVGSCYAQGQRVLSDHVTATLALCVKEAAKGSRQGLRGAAFCLSSNVDSDDGGKAVSDVVALLMLVAEGEGGADFAVALYRLGCCIRDGIGCDADAAVAGTCFEGAAARGTRACDHAMHWHVTTVTNLTVEVVAASPFPNGRIRTCQRRSSCAALRWPHPQIIPSAHLAPCLKI